MHRSTGANSNTREIHAAVKVLLITTKSPYPLNEGRALRTYNLIREMAREHEVHLVSFIQDELDANGIEHMRGICPVVETVPLYYGRLGRAAMIGDVLREPFGSDPVQVVKYRSRRMVATLRGLLSRHAYDLVHLDMLYLACYDDLFGSTPVLLMEHNVEAQILARRADNQPNLLKRAYLRYQQRRLEAYEAAACRRARVVVAVSEPDVEALRTASGGDNIVCVPNGVDTGYFEPATQKAVLDEAHAPTLIYVGGLTWFPNLDAMDHFRRDILPLIQRELPHVRVKAIGRTLDSPQVREIQADPAIELSGLVDDIRPHVLDAAVYIVPLRIGGGTRLKILDAMAMGKAIVSTRIGCEGLQVEDGREIVMADAPAEFAAAVIALLRDPQRCQALGRAGRQRVLQTYDWSAVGRGLSRAYLDAAGAAA